MATAEEMGYVEKDAVDFNYYKAGENCKRLEMTAEKAGDCFDSIAKQHGVVSTKDGCYGSYDNFFMGFYYGEWIDN